MVLLFHTARVLGPVNEVGQLKEAPRRNGKDGGKKSFEWQWVVEGFRDEEIASEKVGWISPFTVASN